LLSADDPAFGPADISDPCSDYRHRPSCTRTCRPPVQEYRDSWLAVPDLLPWAGRICAGQQKKLVRPRTW